MKVWRCLNFVGACLLLSNISTASASVHRKLSLQSERPLKRNTLHHEPLNLKFSDHVIRAPALYKSGSKELVKPGQPFAKYVIPCVKHEDCPHSSKCEDDNLCWCTDNRGLRANRHEPNQPECIDLNSPCENKEHSPCHRKAKCQYFSNKATFACQCKKGYFGDGLTCEKKTASPTTPITTDVEPTTVMITKHSVVPNKPDSIGLTVKRLKHEILTFYHKVLHQTIKHTGLFIIGGGAIGIVSLTIVICLCRRRNRKRREKKLTKNMDDESFFEQQQFSSYPAQTRQGAIYMEPHYENANMDHNLGPLPPIPDATVPPPPPPPPPPGSVSAPPPPPVSTPAAPSSAAPPPPPPPPPPSAPGYQPKQSTKRKEGGRKASANRKAIQGALSGNNGKRRSFSEDVAVAKSVMASQSSFYSDYDNPNY